MSQPTTPEKRKRRRQHDQCLEFRCAYCGLPKSERPPLWCVRAHEVWDSKQVTLLLEIAREDADAD